MDRQGCGALLLALVLTLAAALPAGAQPPGFEGLVEAHNGVRAKLGLPPLRWSDDGALRAQRWADQLARENCVARYDPDEDRRLNWGQNVLRVTASRPYDGWRRNAADVARRWAEESREYDHVSHRCLTSSGTQCGQYLQMIWETTTEVGCGRARCETGEVWVCNYRPRGLQEGLKPYGNPTEPPTTSTVAPAAEVAATAPLECVAVNPGPEYPQSSPVPAR